MDLVVPVVRLEASGGVTGSLAARAAMAAAGGPVRSEPLVVAEGLEARPVPQTQPPGLASELAAVVVAQPITSPRLALKAGQACPVSS